MHDESKNEFLVHSKIFYIPSCRCYQRTTRMSKSFDEETNMQELLSNQNENVFFSYNRIKATLHSKERFYTMLTGFSRCLGPLKGFLGEVEMYFELAKSNVGVTLFSFKTIKKILSA
jgi:hypothetical protein